MAVTFTDKQQQVISSRDRNLLVSAAAGSGKTAVLVERIVRLICDQDSQVDIDRLLVVTFTSAAAAEMRERISDAIAERLAAEPEREHLQRQATLLHNAQITTIDSFCLFILRNQFHTIGLDPGFRIGDEGELKLLRADVLADLLEREYAAADPEFLYCMEYFSTGSRDQAVEELVLKLYDFAMSNPFPEEWLLERKQDYALPENGVAFEKLDWVRGMLQEAAKRLEGCAEQLALARRICEEPDGPYFYGELLEREEEQAEKLAGLCAQENAEFDAISAAFAGLRFDRLPSKKDDTVSLYKRESVKAQRNEVKEILGDLRDSYFARSREQICAQMAVCGRAVCALADLVLHFKAAFDEKKREKNLLDFDDVEHLALSMLVRRTEDGAVEATETAKEYRSFFYEIMIDEYQDSNLVQEYLLSAISGESEGHYNRFMVGDVKQSIYKFRLARPELFLDKYKAYETADPLQARKIDLHRNFRSRREVLESTNYVFSQVMGEDVGGIAYDEQAALHPGAEYPEGKAGEYGTELLLFQTEDAPDELTVREQEAYGVAAKIKELMRDLRLTQKSSEGMSLRKISYRDIVILLRTTSGWDEVFQRVLEEQGIPVHVTSRTGYFAAQEVQELLHFLRVLDNPLQDIPLYGAMRSCLGGFDEEEIAQIRVDGAKESYLYDAVVHYPQGERAQTESMTQEEEAKSRVLQDKIREFCGRINRYREMAVYLSVEELLQTILRESGYLQYVAARPDGIRRRANVQMLLVRAEEYARSSYFGLYHFLRYMEQLEKYEVDYGEAGMPDENADVVRLMSIHKSKGLEFPVCFVCGLSKKFQARDYQAHLVVDVDAGIGTDYADPVKRVRCQDVRRRVVADRLRKDTMAEEMRILYVAMTRAKEKLILTATLKSVEKTAGKLLPMQMRQKRELPYERLLAASCPLDWILGALCRNRCMDVLYESGGVQGAVHSPMYMEETYTGVTLKTWEKQEGEEVEEAVRGELLKSRLQGSDRKQDTDEELMTLMSERFSYRYPHENLAKLYTKTTVSELKKAGMQGDQEEAAARLFEEETVVPYLPHFIKNDDRVSGTQRGTAFHRVMELLDFKAFYDILQETEQPVSGHRIEVFVQEQLRELCREGVLPKEYAELVSVQKLQTFLQSRTAQRMADAAHRGRLYREQPFVLGIPAERLNSAFPATETVLIQGIIDVFWEEEDALVLLDYKTDVVTHPQELVERYRVQLDYYQQALERIYQNRGAGKGNKVREKLIYSFRLGEEIRICTDQDRAEGTVHKRDSEAE